MARVPPNQVAALERAKAASFAQLLLQCARRFDELAIARVRDRSGIDLRSAHTSLFPHIDLAGTRLTELARRLGVSKQAVAPLVDDLVEMGALERVPDPDDARAKLIVFAKRRGRVRIHDGLAVLGELEAEAAAAVGKDKLRTLHAILGELLVWLRERGDADPG
ncbi:MAG: MarR family transcriptional regulator [Deltaproteobacteria bacterium]|nr:MarR family transcriptional regulator [Deltaproteobacteria bacterium]MBK8235833.1 MarR family transcriptional regulator [Deltaproteobacteria bacterium]MBK8713462.1 MarR family transcriptional regulator [Deltaproteobacteria bacterium]MBP7288087.1 MarR family transcriptional regulator [Nannocystaceae bacterium]